MLTQGLRSQATQHISEPGPPPRGALCLLHAPRMWCRGAACRMNLWSVHEVMEKHPQQRSLTHAYHLLENGKITPSRFFWPVAFKVDFHNPTLERLTGRIAPPRGKLHHSGNHHHCQIIIIFLYFGHNSIIICLVSGIGDTLPFRILKWISKDVLTSLNNRLNYREKGYFYLLWLEFNWFLMSLAAHLIIAFQSCQLFLMKLQRKLFLSSGEGDRPGRAGGDAGGQGLCPPWLARRGERDAAPAPP